jgi:tetratricopeptide (TPR) repeat protein
MNSQNLDETSPTSAKSEGQSEPMTGDALPKDSNVAEQASGINVTQPMPVIAEGHSARQSNVDAAAGSSTAEAGVPTALEATQPSVMGDDGVNLPPEIPEEPEVHHRGKRMWVVWAFVVVLLLALIAGGSGFAGYNSAIDQRTHYQSTLVAGEATNQYTLALQDIALGNYDRARQRLEYLIKLDPNFPDASAQLAFVLTQQRITATPTQAPIPTLTPTPDYRGRDDLFTEAQNRLNSRDWTGTIDTLLLLRKNFPDYMAVKVDDMLFVALRNRGIDKIANLHDLEGGNYDLTLAERFGPIDTEARNWRDWADLYIRGASFWDVDWAQAVYYFSELASSAPNLSDLSGWTASNRYMDALLGYGDWFAAKGQWCDAQTQYDTYMALLASPQVEPTAVFASDKCTESKAPPPAPPTEAVATPSPTLEVTQAPPTETPTESPTEAPTGVSTP